MTTSWRATSLRNSRWAGTGCRRGPARVLTKAVSKRSSQAIPDRSTGFFGVLKSEYFYLNKFTSVEQLVSGIAEYIRYYNHDRIKLRLNGLSPVQFRTQHSAA